MADSLQSEFFSQVQKRLKYSPPSEGWHPTTGGWRGGLLQLILRKSEFANLRICWWLMADGWWPMAESCSFALTQIADSSIPLKTVNKLWDKRTKKVPLWFLLFLMESANHFVRFQDWAFLLKKTKFIHRKLTNLRDKMLVASCQILCRASNTVSFYEVRKSECD